MSSEVQSESLIRRFIKTASAYVPQVPKPKRKISLTEKFVWTGIALLAYLVMGQIPLNAMPCVPYAGPDVGFRFLPDNEAAVWVEFEGGNPSHPIWTGCFWKEKEFPRIEDGPEIKIIKTRR